MAFAVHRRRHVAAASAAAGRRIRHALAALGRTAAALATLAALAAADTDANAANANTAGAGIGRFVVVLRRLAERVVAGAAVAAAVRRFRELGARRGVRRGHLLLHLGGLQTRWLVS